MISCSPHLQRQLRAVQNHQSSPRPRSVREEKENENDSSPHPQSVVLPPHFGSQIDHQHYPLLGSQHASSTWPAFAPTHAIPAIDRPTAAVLHPYSRRGRLPRGARVVRDSRAAWLLRFGTSVRACYWVNPRHNSVPFLHDVRLQPPGRDFETSNRGCEEGLERDIERSLRRMETNQATRPAIAG